MSNMVVRTNVFALNAHRNMKNVGFEQRRASNRLASGYRINSAADDAAGLAISESMRAQIRGLDQASRNSQDGQAMILTTEGGLEEIGNMLQRTRELLVQSANDTNTNDQRTMIQQEIQQLGREITSMQRRVEFNTNRVLNMGPPMDSDVLDFISEAQETAVGLRDAMQLLEQNERDVIAALELLGNVDGTVSFVNLGNAVQNAVNRASVGIELDGIENLPLIDSSDVEDIDEIDDIDDDTTVSEIIALLNTRLEDIQTQRGYILADVAGIHDDAAEQFDDIKDFANGSTSGNFNAFFQVGANSSQGITFDFETVSRSVASAGATVALIAGIQAMPGAGSGIGTGINVTQLINRIQASLDDVNSVRANLGALQNRMDYTMRSIDVSSENLSDSESRVRNADMAREMMRFTMSNVLQQASISMLAQANQLPNNLLQLLR